MRNYCLAVGLFVLATLAQASSAAAVTVTIADYQDDFQGPTPATGWSYKTNSLGAIGNTANYTNLISNPGGTQYNLSGGTLPVSGSYASLNMTSGHPGKGTAEGATVDQYVIASYTIQSADVTGYFSATNFQLTNTSIGNSDLGGGPLDLRVYVNNTLIGSPLNFNGTVTTTFTYDRSLGDLVAGDTVYVAVGPSVSHGNDAFNRFDFTIQFEGYIPPAPEPSSAMLLGAGMLGLSIVRRRKANRQELG